MGAAARTAPRCRAGGANTPPLNGKEGERVRSSARPGRASRAPHPPPPPPPPPPPELQSRSRGPLRPRPGRAEQPIDGHSHASHVQHGGANVRAKPQGRTRFSSPFEQPGRPCATQSNKESLSGHYPIKPAHPDCMSRPSATLAARAEHAGPGYCR